jgi:non-homologous end joining protein Ku
VTISFALVSFSVDLLPATISKSIKKESFTNICPKCDEPHKLRQQYVCSFDDTHGPFTTTDAAKAITTADGTLRRCTPEEIESVSKAAARSLSVDLSVFPADQIENATLPSGTVYRLKLRNPNKGSMQSYALLVELVRNQEYAFVCEITMRSVERMFRLTANNGALTIVELARPEDVYSTEPIEMPLDDKIRALADRVVEEYCDEFDPQSWASKRAARIEALRGSSEQAPSTVTAPEAGKVEDLMDLLERSIAA